MNISVNPDAQKRAGYFKTLEAIGCKIRTQKAKAVVSAVNEVLYKEWAPIQVDGLPLDEYESYAIEIVSLLASGADSTDLATYLCSTYEHITGNTTDIKSVNPS